MAGICEVLLLLVLDKPQNITRWDKRITLNHPRVMSTRTLCTTAVVATVLEQMVDGGYNGRPTWDRLKRYLRSSAISVCRVFTNDFRTFQGWSWLEQELRTTYGY